MSGNVKMILMEAAHSSVAWGHDASFTNAMSMTRLAGLLVLHDGAISHNRPQIASDHTIHEKLHNS